MSGRGVAARRAAWLLAAAVLATLLWVAVRRLDLARVAIEVRRARPEWILATLLCFAAILPLWAAQWYLLAPAAPRRTLRGFLGVVCMTSSILNTTPMLVGEAAGVWLLVQVTGMDRASALAVLGMDQLLVGLAKLTVLAAAASALPLPPAIRSAVRALALGVALLLGLLMAVAWSGAALRRVTRSLPARLAHAAMRAAAALSPLRSPMRGGGAFALALLKKGAELLGILCVQHAFGTALPPQSALLVLVALNLATLLPLVPGNAGVFEAAVVLAYAWLGVPPERALGMALVQHASYFAALALPGYWWLARSPRPRSAAAAP